MTGVERVVRVDFRIALLQPESHNEKYQGRVRFPHYALGAKSPDDAYALGVLTITAALTR